MFAQCFCSREICFLIVPKSTALLLRTLAAIRINRKFTKMNSINDYWFLDARVRIRVLGDNNDDEISVLEHQPYYGDSSPLHIHHSEDEVFLLYWKENFVF